MAHDPGQGDEIGQTQLVASVMDGGAVNVAASLPGVETCDLFNPVRTTARRTGQTLHGTLERKEASRFSGAIALPERGRWFVYAELTRSGEDLEAWIAVIISDNPLTFERSSSLYIRPESTESPLKVVGGVIVYAADLVLVGAVIVLFRLQPAQYGREKKGRIL